MGGERREMLLSVTTVLKRRLVIYTTGMPYSDAQLLTFVKLVREELAALNKLNP